MTMTWSNTQNALKEFANILKCMSCDSQPILPIRNIPCGHVFCKECRGTDSRCVRCNEPVQPTEIVQDKLIENLVHDCNVISEIVSQRNLWNPRMYKPHTQVKTPCSTPQKSQQSPSKKSNIGLRNIPRNINKANHKGETPLHIACIKGNDERVKTLLEAGANPNTKDYSNWTPLQEVVNYGFTNICRLLLKHGALPNTTGNENRTALHEAVLKNMVEETKLLLEYNASINVYDQYGKTPKDYASKELLKVLEQQEGPNETLNKSAHNQSFNISQSSFIAPNTNIVVYASQLNTENQELLSRMATKHNIRVVSTFEPNVTHLILETNGQYTTNSGYDVMMAIIRGCWLLDSAWLSLCADIDDITTLDLEVFELAAAPIEHVPKKARENAQQKKPGLFNNCKFFFAMQANEVHLIGDVKLTKESLMKLVTEGGGTVLTREPDADHIKDNRTLIPFHIANDLKHPLYKCTHYIIYVPGKAQPRRMYNKPYIKSLPLLWLIESIERFTLVDPTHLGIL